MSTRVGGPGSRVRRAAAAEALEIAGPAGALQALVESPVEAPRAMALLCHPHPLHQGTMHNKVVFTLARSFQALGAVAVRFNFRGVGRSQGAHSGGPGETEDAIAVGLWMRRRWPELPLYLGGFSFGAAIALKASVALDPRGVVTVALPVARVGASFAPPRCPWLVIQGSEDDVTPAEALLRWLAGLERQPERQLLEGAGHFLHGRLGEITEAVTRFFEPGMGRAGEGSHA